MSTFQTVAEKPVAMAELKEELARVKQRDGELNFRAQKTEEYLAKFVEIGKAKAEELLKKLTELNIARVKPEHYIKVIDVMPSTSEEVKAIISGYSVTISNENCGKIVEVLGNAK